MAKPGVAGAIKRLVKSGFARDVAHEHKHGNDRQTVGQRRLVHRLTEQGERGVGIDQKQRAEKGGQPHRKPDRHSTREQREQQAEDQYRQQRRVKSMRAERIPMGKWDALGVRFCACPFRKTGIHFSGTCLFAERPRDGGRRTDPCGSPRLIGFDGL